MHKLAIVSVSLFLATTAFASPAKEGVVVPLKNAKGEEMGRATLHEMDKGVHVVLEVKGLAPGEHGVHFHQNGKCEGPDFKTAGDHYSPTSAEHGTKSKKGPHAGDLKNIKVGKDGSGKLEQYVDKLTLKSGTNSLLKEGGTSLIVHEKADDYKTQPSGDSGGRLLCGEIGRG